LLFIRPQLRLSFPRVLQADRRLVCCQPQFYLSLLWLQLYPVMRGGIQSGLELEAVSASGST